MKLDMRIFESGEFRAVRHTGHTYDANGNEIHGEILQESDWGHNLITSVGFDYQLQNDAVPTSIVVGSGNTAPASSNTTLQTYKGKYTSQIQVSRAVNLVADAEGFYTITTIFRATFNPGSLGSGAQNISEAGTAMADVGSVTSATNLYSRGLLVDSFGSPLVISLNASTEYLDIYWKHTRYIPAEVTGSQVLTIMGSSIVHDYTIRPLYLDPAVSSAGIPLTGIWWALGSGLTAAAKIPGLGASVTDTAFTSPYFGPRFFDGDIAAIGVHDEPPAGTQASYSGSAWTFDTYVTGSASRKCKLNVIPTEGNLVSGIKSMTLKFSFQGWQVQFDPVIMKNATPARVLRLDFTVSLANKA